MTPFAWPNLAAPAQVTWLRSLAQLAPPLARACATSVLALAPLPLFAPLGFLRALGALLLGSLTFSAAPPSSPCPSSPSRSAGRRRRRRRRRPTSGAAAARAPTSAERAAPPRLSGHLRRPAPQEAAAAAARLSYGTDAATAMGVPAALGNLRGGSCLASWRMRAPCPPAADLWDGRGVEMQPAARISACVYRAPATARVR